MKNLMEQEQDNSGEFASSVRVWTYFVGIALLSTFYILLQNLEWKSGAGFHTVLETGSTILAGVVGTLALVRYYARRNSVFLLLGAGFLGTGFLDGYHAVVTSSYFSDFLPSEMHSLIPWSWIASRQFLSIFAVLLVSAEFLEKKGSVELWKHEKVIYSLAASFTIASFLFFALVPLPAAYYPDLSFHRPEEFVPGALFGIALIGQFTLGKWRIDSIHHWLIIFLIISVLNQLFIMSLSAELFDLEFDLAHFLKFVSYLCVFIGITVNIRLTYQQIEETGEARRKAQILTDRTLFELEQQKSALDKHNTVAIHDRNLKLTYVNQRYCDMTGFSSDEVLGGPLGGQMTPAALPNREEHRHVIETVSNAKVWHGELRNVCKDGRLIWTETTIVPFLDQTGEISKYVAIGTDISERKRAISDLENRQVEMRAQYDELSRAREWIEKQSNRYKNQAADLEKARDESKSATLAKTEFLANMSHEIRTPMNGVLGMGRLLQDTELNTDQKHYVDAICESSASLLTLLNDIIDFVRLGSDRIVIEAVNFKTRPLIDQVISLFRVEANKNSLQLSVSVDKDVPEYLIGDPGRIKQVLVNLVGNAIKFTNMGSISISVIFDQQSNSEFGQLKIEVTDTGIGIPPEAQSRLFERFVQADSSTTRKYGGSGLGLSISRALVELMNGKIGLTSDGETGSTFWFYVDCKKAELAHYVQDKALSHTPKMEPIHVLLAEDQRINQLYVVVSLEKYGHTLQIVENGIEALEALERTKFDLVLMDIQMPVLDGVGATRRIRKSNTAYKDIPIIALTANALPEQVETYLAEGMDDVLTKPVEIPDLMAALQRILRNRSEKHTSTGEDNSISVNQQEDKEGKAPEIQIPDCAPVIDKDHLEKMAADLGVARTSEILDLFFEDAQSTLSSLRDAVTKGEHQIAREIAHGLKGIAATSGAKQIEVLASEIQLFEGDPNLALLRDLDDLLANTKQQAEYVLNAMRN